VLGKTVNVTLFLAFDDFEQRESFHSVKFDLKVSLWNKLIPYLFTHFEGTDLQIVHIESVKVFDKRSKLKVHFKIGECDKTDFQQSFFRFKVILLQRSVYQIQRNMSLDIRKDKIFILKIQFVICPFIEQSGHYLGSPNFVISKESELLGL